MKTLKATLQKLADKVWKDETGNLVQTARLSKTERLMERAAGAILKESIRLHNDLARHKNNISTLCQEVYETYFRERNLEPNGKGNFTFYNFDRTIKIEVEVNDRIEFDEMGINASKQLLDEFLMENVTTKEDIIRQLIIDAFSTSRGKLDNKKIMNLIRYRTKVKNAKFAKAIDFLEQSIRKPDSRVYFRVWQREPGGKFESIDLNFSSI